MAKNTAPTPAPAAPPPLVLGGFQIDFGVPLPASRRFASDGKDNPIRTAMDGLPAPDGERVASFFLAAEVADTITDATERAKAARDNARKTANRLSTLVRRIVKADPSKAFAIRSVEEHGKIGIRVYRVAPAAKADAPVTTA